MSDMIEMFQAMKDHRKEMRAALGVNCPKCSQVRPKAHPSILLPGQRCKVDGYRDLRPISMRDDWRPANAIETTPCPPAPPTSTVT